MTPRLRIFFTFGMQTTLTTNNFQPIRKTEVQKTANIYRPRYISRWVMGVNGAVRGPAVGNSDSSVTIYSLKTPCISCILC